MAGTVETVEMAVMEVAVAMAVAVVMVETAAMAAMAAVVTAPMAFLLDVMAKVEMVLVVETVEMAGTVETVLLVAAVVMEVTVPVVEMVVTSPFKSMEILTFGIEPSTHFDFNLSVDKVAMLDTQAIVVKQDQEAVLELLALVVVEEMVGLVHPTATVVPSVLVEAVVDLVDKWGYVIAMPTTEKMATQDIQDKLQYNNFHWRHHDLGMDRAMVVRM